MKIFCPSCDIPLTKKKIQVGEYVNVKRYECDRCTLKLRTEE
jgi:hypothetical protein